MNFAQSLFSRALLAAALITGAGAAAAAPIYHVDIDTSSLKDYLTGYLDLTFLAGGMSGPATATVSNFSGEYIGADPDLAASGLSGSLDTAVVFDNAYYGDLYREIKLGKHFSFDVVFNGPTDGFGGTDFDVSLYDSTGFDYLPDGASVVHFGLKPDGFDLSVTESLASVSRAAEVPEPSAAALVLIGLMMAGAVARRRA